MQAKLLRVIQEKEIERIGGTSPKRIDVRIIAATNKNLEELVIKGQFREDLFYRLNVITLNIPPLRERKKILLKLLITI
ncbi:sigma 54-interacting transcriptional regulator [Caloramator sp. mosi_1]|nr:sigma 54-interacting transcriptional regulator [Caloramator sp. mosi_1]WDC84342.1 sigma 54-interacting transcriptional regulator [Caloramator sp. mosi_1]